LEKQMTAFTARRNANGNLSLRADGQHFGTIYLRADGSVSGGSFVDAYVNECFGALKNFPAATVPEALVRSRRAYEMAGQP
jgi:hypothetical protein